MAFPRNLLNDGEELVLDLKPHWWSFAGPATMLAASVIALLVVTAMLDGDVEEYLVLVVAGVTVGALAWFVKRYVQWSTTNFVITGDVRRSTRIVVTGVGLDGGTVEIDADAFEARAIQHELDHLDGLLFLDRVVAGDRVFRRRTYR